MALFYALLFGSAIFMISYHYMQKVFDWLRFQSLGTRDYIVEMLGKMFIDTTPNKVLLYMILAAVVPFTLCFLIMLPKVIPGIVLGLIFGTVCFFLPKPVINLMYRKRIEKFNLQMVDGLNLMANAMRSGLSVPQALGIVVEQMPKPICEEFGLVLSENKVGVTLEDAFENMGKRVVCEDVEMFVTSVNILKETGGNLAETFDTIVFTIRERIKVDNKIKALTAQGFYQGMMLLSVPPLLLAYFGFSEPGFLDPLIETPIGWIILGVSAILEVIAYFVIMKVIKVDV